MIVWGDQAWLRKIVESIVSNAIKFTNEGGITISAEKREDGITINIGDTGIGIVEENKETLFKEFSKIQGTGATQHAGSGLGLALSKRLVLLHGGEIWFTSEPGRGSTFSFSIPAKVVGKINAAT